MPGPCVIVTSVSFDLWLIRAKLPRCLDPVLAPGLLAFGFFAPVFTLPYAEKNEKKERKFRTHTCCTWTIGRHSFTPRSTLIKCTLRRGRGRLAETVSLSALVRERSTRFENVARLTRFDKFLPSSCAFSAEVGKRTTVCLFIRW